MHTRSRLLGDLYLKSIHGPWSTKLSFPQKGKGIHYTAHGQVFGFRAILKGLRTGSYKRSAPLVLNQWGAMPFYTALAAGLSACARTLFPGLLPLPPAAGLTVYSAYSFARAIVKAAPADARHRDDKKWQLASSTASDLS
jgi:hypothetical protein